MAHKVLLLKTMGSPRSTQPDSMRRKMTPDLRKYANIVGHGSPYNPLATTEEGFDEDENVDKYISAEHASPFSNTSFACLLVQSLPLLVVYPVRRIIIWFLIAGPWVELLRLGLGRFYSLLLAMFIMRASLAIFAPLAGVLLKWVLIGKFQPGRYPLWGSMCVDCCFYFCARELKH